MYQGTEGTIAFAPLPVLSLYGGFALNEQIPNPRVLSDVYSQNQLLVEGHRHGGAALDAVSRVLEFGMPR